MRLLASYTAAEVGLGHLIQQSSASANRGAWRGSGFEATTQGWASIRAAKGLLLSTSARAGTYGSAQGTQMDAGEALGQLKAMRELGQRLSAAGQSAQAHALTTHDAAQAVEKFIDAIDAAKLGKHEGPVNGQEAKKAQGRTLTGPVEAFALPLVLLDTPSTAAFSSEASIASFSGQDLSLVAQGDVQHTAAHTYAGVSGQTSSLFTHAGGIKAFAANGPVSLRAHTDELQILADKDVTVISVNAEIRIQANSRIEIVAGQSSVVLEGSNITFTCPGKFEVKGSGHAFLGGSGAAAQLEALPTGVAGQEPNFIELNYHDDDLAPLAGYPYRVVFEDGAVREGRLDGNGYARLEGVPNQSAQVFFGDSLKSFSMKAVAAVQVTDDTLVQDLRKIGLDPDKANLQALVEHEAGRTA